MLAALTAINPDDVSPIIIGPGCTRRDLTAPAGVRVWIVDMMPGAQWPKVDVHDETGEVVFVLDGELIEGEQRLAAGTYMVFGPHSRHQPRTDTGVRLLGFNLLPEQRQS